MSKRLLNYIKENSDSEIKPLNESLLLMCLAGALLMHFGIRITKHLKNGVNSAWDWVLGGKLNVARESKESSEENIISEMKEKSIHSEIYPLQVDKFERLPALFKIYGGKKGFKYMPSVIRENPDMQKLNAKPLYMNYVCMLNGEKDDPEIYGLMGFSYKYWENADFDNIDTDYLNNYVHVTGIEILPGYDVHSTEKVLKACIMSMKEVMKSVHADGLTINVNEIKVNSEEIYNFALVLKYSGFKQVEGLENYYMYSK